MSIKKKKLMVVVGAGASIDLGMPSTAQIDNLFCQWSNEGYKLADIENQNLYSYIRDEINRYYSWNSKSNSVKKTNFEEVLYVILQMSTALSDKNYKLPMNAFSCLKRLPEIISLQGEKFVDGNDLSRLCSYLIDRLTNEFRERCKNAKESSPENFKHFNSFITQLNKDYEVAFISLNYDNLITQVCPDLFTGFNKCSGDFDVASVYERDRWGLIYHLHGSVHFDMPLGSSDLHTIKWNHDLNSTFNGNACGRNSQNTSEGIQMPTSIIVAGYGKTNQIQRVPFRTYYTRLDDIALTADAFLFLGYGFNDLHLNNCFHSIRKGKKGKPVVIGRAEDNKNPMEFRNDEWVSNLCNTIPTKANEMATRQLQHAPHRAAELKSDGKFEISTNPDFPLAIWYGGFISACRNYQKIKEEIDDPR